MNKILTLAALLFCMTAGALPPAGAPTFRHLVKQSQVYQNAIGTLDVAEEPVVEQIDHYGEDMPEALRQGSCRPATMSKSGALARVTVRTKDTTLVLFFGSISSLAEDTVLCQ